MNIESNLVAEMQKDGTGLKGKSFDKSSLYSSTSYFKRAGSLPFHISWLELMNTLVFMPQS